MNNNPSCQKEDRKFRGTWAPILVNSNSKKHETFPGMNQCQDNTGNNRISPSIREMQKILFDERGAPKTIHSNQEQSEISEKHQACQNDQPAPPNPPRINHPMNDQQQQQLILQQQQLQQQQQQQLLQQQIQIQEQQRLQLQQQQQLQQNQQYLNDIQAQQRIQQQQMMNDEYRRRYQSSWIPPTIPLSIPTCSYSNINPTIPAVVHPQPLVIPPPFPSPPQQTVVGVVHTDLGDDSALPVMYQYPY